MTSHFSISAVSYLALDILGLLKSLATFHLFCFLSIQVTLHPRDRHYESHCITQWKKETEYHHS